MKGPPMHLVAKKCAVMSVALASLLLAAGCTSASTTAGVPTGSQSANAASDGSNVAAATLDAEAAALLPADVKAKGTLVVGTDPTFPPFELYAPDNKTVVGFDADIATALSQTLGLKVELVPATFDTILPGIASKKYDLGISAFSETPERRKNADFVTYSQGGSAIAVPAGNPKSLSTDFTSLCGMKIAGQKGTTQGIEILPEFSAQCAAAGKPAIDIQLFPSQNDANLALRSGRVDGVMSESSSMAYQGKLANGAFELAPGKDFDPGTSGIALPKDSALTPAVRAAMTALVQSPVYQQINSKWGLPDGNMVTVDQVAGK